MSRMLRTSLLAGKGRGLFFARGTMAERRSIEAHAGHTPLSYFDNPYLLLALASLFWSGNHIVGRAITGHVPPIGISMVRWLIPALVLGLLARRHIHRDWPLIRAHWAIMLWLGLTGGTLFTTLQYVGLQYTSALNVSVLNSLVPVLILAAGVLLFRDRIGAVQLAGIATSSIGVLIIITRGHFATLRELEFNWGDLIIIVNMMVFAVYAAFLRLRPQIHWLSFMFVLAVVSAAGTFPFFLWEEASGTTFHATLLTALAILYVSIFPSVLAFAAWNRGVEVIGANRSGPFLHLIPIYTALLASTLLGETLAAHHVAGFLLIIAGVWLASHGKNKTTPSQ
jgi:drug/metabolite transporter (DMT)-like permease